MLMPAVGWFVGATFEQAISGVDHWIAFGLLAFIGLKMIYDSTKKGVEGHEETLKLHSVLTLSVATSIDALMVGLSFAFLGTSLIEPLLMIGVVTFLFSVAGFFFGCSLGKVFGNRMKFVGGIILITIGLRILLEHIL